jgi:hypothetical protein
LKAAGRVLQPGLIRCSPAPAAPRLRLRADQRHLDGDGSEVFAAACKMGFEGIVSKQRHAPNDDIRPADETYHRAEAEPLVTASE